MNKLSLHALLSSAALTALLLSGGAQAQLVNGDFQNGLSGWSTTGDVLAQGGSMTLTTAFNDSEEGPFNLSGNPAEYITVVEAAAGVAAFGLDLSLDEYGVEGSLARQSFGVAAGQTLSFSWTFSTLETLYQDHAFIVLDGQVLTLASRSGGPFGAQSYSHTFSNAGTATLAVGVIDTGDAIGVSSLNISDVQLTTAVPEPAPAALLLAGLGIVGLLARRRRG